MSTHIRGESLTFFDFCMNFFYFNILFLYISLCFISGGGYCGNQENRYVGFGNTVTPEKKEDDFINNAMTSIYSVGHDVYILSELYFLLYVSSSEAIFHIFLFFHRAGAPLLLEQASLLLSLKIM